MNLGAHLSIAGGLSRAVETAGKLKINSLQIFSGSPRGWGFALPTAPEQEKFRQLAKKHHVSHIFIHAKYLINLAGNNRDVQTKSILSLKQDLDLAVKIGARGVIFHPHPENLTLLIKNIKTVLKQTAGGWLILENSAQMKIEKVIEILKLVKNPRLKLCLDTAHAFEAGYDFNRPGETEKIFAELKKIKDSWKVIHFNDSKTGCGSRHDVHADIGEGLISQKAMLIFLHHPLSEKLPFILETPAVKKEGLSRF